jgi:integrase
MSMLMLLRRRGVENATTHGFRSTLRDWVGDCTQFPRELAEASLAHVAGDQTERAYRRSDALERRQGLMESWANYCTAVAAGNVIALRPKAV